MDVLDNVDHLLIKAHQIVEVMYCLKVLPKISLYQLVVQIGTPWALLTRGVLSIVASSLMNSYIYSHEKTPPNHHEQPDLCKQPIHQLHTYKTHCPPSYRRVHEKAYLED